MSRPELDPASAAVNAWNTTRANDLLGRMLTDQAERVGSGSPDGLALLAGLHGRLDEAMIYAVWLLRQRRWRWEQIGDALGITRQAAYNRFAVKIRAFDAPAAD